MVAPVKPYLEVLRASHPEPIPRIGFKETETAWIVEGEARRGGDFDLTVGEAEVDAMTILSNAFGTWIRNSLNTINRGSNVPGAHVDRLVERARQIFSKNKIIAKRRSVYWEYIAEQVPGQLMDLYYDVRVHMSISNEERLRITRDTLRELSEEYSQARNEQLHQDLLRLLEEAEAAFPDQNRIPPQV